MSAKMIMEALEAGNFTVGAESVAVGKYRICRKTGRISAWANIDPQAGDLYGSGMFWSGIKSLKPAQLERYISRKPPALPEPVNIWKKLVLTIDPYMIKRHGMVAGSAKLEAGAGEDDIVKWLSNLLQAKITKCEYFVLNKNLMVEFTPWASYVGPVTKIFLGTGNGIKVGFKNADVPAFSCRPAAGIWEGAELFRGHFYGKEQNRIHQPGWFGANSYKTIDDWADAMYSSSPYYILKVSRGNASCFDGVWIGRVPKSPTVQQIANLLANFPDADVWSAMAFYKYGETGLNAKTRRICKREFYRGLEK